MVPDANDAEATILELDERWSFVLKKTKQAWSWIALCRKTRQVVAYAVGDRSEKTCRTLWQAIPAASRRGHCYTDFWKAYQAVLRSASNIQQSERKPEQRHMWSAGRTHDDNGWLGLSARRFLSPNRGLCMMLVCASFSIATTVNEPACSCEPLPSQEMVESTQKSVCISCASRFAAAILPYAIGLVCLACNGFSVPGIASDPISTAESLPGWRCQHHPCRSVRSRYEHKPFGGAALP
jgi:IS1 family transposase